MANRRKTSRGIELPRIRANGFSLVPAKTDLVIKELEQGAKPPLAHPRSHSKESNEKYSTKNKSIVKPFSEKER